MKTVCAFLNSGGGTLMIGAAGTGEPKGPEDDLKDFPDNSDALVSPMSTASEAAANTATASAIAGLGLVGSASVPETGLRTASAPW